MYWPTKRKTQCLRVLSAQLRQDHDDFCRKNEIMPGSSEPAERPEDSDDSAGSLIDHVQENEPEIEE